MRTTSLERIIYFQDYVVVDPGDTPLKERQLMTEEEFRKAKEQYKAGGQYGEEFQADMGAEAVRKLLMRLDLVSLSKQLRQELVETSSKQKIKDLTKRLKVVEALRDSDNRPEWMVLECIPVIPPDLRPAGPPGFGQLRHQRLERPVPANHQPQQPAQEAGRPERARGDHPQRKADAPAGRRRLVRQQPLQAAGPGKLEPPA